MTLEVKVHEAVYELDVDVFDSWKVIIAIIAKFYALYLEHETKSTFETHRTFERSEDFQIWLFFECSNKFEQLPTKINNYSSDMSSQVSQLARGR